MMNITLTLKDIERLASSALDMDTVFDIDNDGRYVTLGYLLFGAGIDREDLRDAAEQGIIDYLERDKSYIRHQIEAEIQNHRDEAERNRMV